jgi:predicted nucleic acid-binding Zn ribbon protein
MSRTALGQNLIYYANPFLLEMTTSAAPHKHCIVCGNTVGAEESFCDELCESKYKSAQRRQQILFIIFVVLLLLIVLLPALVNTKGFSP